MKKIVALIFALCPTLILAQGFQLHTQGIKQQATGGSGTAFIQDAATIYYNPAGMSLLDGNSVIIGGNFVSVKSSFRDSALIVDVDENNKSITHAITKPGITVSAFCVYGFDSTALNWLQNFKFGLGVYTPVGTSAEWKNNWNGRFLVEKLDIKTLNIQPTASYKIADKLSVGAGFVYTYGIIHKVNDQNTPNTAGEYLTVDLKGDFHAFGANIGAHYKINDAISVGVRYSTEMNGKIKDGDFKTTNLAKDLTDSVPNGKFNLTLPLPRVLSLGVAYKVNENLDFTTDFTFYEYSVFKEFAVDFENNTQSFEDVTEPRGFQDTYAVMLGGQYKINESIYTRLGIRYVTSAVPDGKVTPENPDADRFAYSAGAGYKINDAFTVDASFSYENVKRSDNNTYYGIAGDYKTNAAFTGLSLTYNY